MTAFNICRESFKSSSLSVWLLDSKCLHFDLWNLTGIQFIKACIKNKGLLFLKIIHRGHQAGGSTVVLGQVFGLEGPKMVLLGSTTSKIAIRFFLMFCTLMIILLVADRAFNKIMSIKIKVTSMIRASRNYFKFTPEAYFSTYNNAFQS